MKTIFFYLFLFSSYLTLNAQFQLVGSIIDGKKAYNHFGESVSINDDGDIIAIGTPSNDSIANNAGQVLIFKNINNVWIQLGSSLFGNSKNDYFGYKVSISGNGKVVAVSVGSPSYFFGSKDRGSVYVYQFINNDWFLMDSAINGENDSDNFGYSVSLSQDGLKLAISAPHSDVVAKEAGQMKVYEYKNNKWSQLGSSIYGEDIDDNGGSDVSINSNGDVIAFGISNNQGVNGGIRRGKVKIYTFKNNDWVQFGNDIIGEGNNDASGSSISLSSDGKTIAIGAPINNAAGQYQGHTRVFKFWNNTWNQIGDDIDGEYDNDYSGESVSISDSGDIVAISSTYSDGNFLNSNRGQVRLFKNENGNWVQLGGNIDGDTDQEEFGKSVSLSSNGLIVGASAWKNSSVGLEAGQVRVYQYPMQQSINTINSKTKIIFWPNPTNEYLYLENINEVKQILIHNTLGIEVLNLNTFENALNKIDLSILNNGLYYMTIIQNDKIITEKINLIK